MNRTYHFISGLPRSGSTLLSSILKQNPRFSAGISDPLHSFVHSIIRDINSSVGIESQVSIPKRQQLLRDLFDIYYKDHPAVCFNTNRGWCADTALLKQLFPNFKMIVMVRHVPWILNSFELLHRQNPLTIKAIYNYQDLLTVHERCAMLMGELPNLAGYVWTPLLSVQQVMSCADQDHVCYVEYDDLVQNSKAVLQHIYNFLDEPWFEHDFLNVADDHSVFDQQARITGLHEVRAQVSAVKKPVVLPAGMWDKYSSQSFWRLDHNLQNTLRWAPHKPSNQHLKGVMHQSHPFYTHRQL